MNSPTITMERESAVARLEEYEEAARKNPKLRTELDRQVMQGYRIMARGGRLVDLNEAIRHGGLNIAGLPKLAVARADAKSARWGMRSNTSMFWWHESSRYDDRYKSDRFCWVVPPGFFDYSKTPRRDFEAMTPLIPLPHRPKHDLSNYFLLWEANWFALPVDPYLLRPVVGPLMEIIAEWEVSPLELAAVRAAIR